MIMGRIYGRGIQPKLSKGIGVLFVKFENIVMLQVSLKYAFFPM